MRCMRAAEGQSTFKVNGVTAAQAEAVALSEAFAAAYVSSNTCHKCVAVAEVVVKSVSKLVLSVAAKIETDILGVTDGVPIGIIEKTDVVAIAEQEIIAFAQVLLDATLGSDCGAFVSAEANTGSDAFPSGSRCIVETKAADGSLVQNAVSQIINMVTAEACKATVKNEYLVEAEVRTQPHMHAMRIGCAFGAGGVGDDAVRSHRRPLRSDDVVIETLDFLAGARNSRGIC